jgi:hypothetical protein
MESTAMDDFKFQAGDMVIVGQTFTSLAEIRRFVRETAAIEIGFEDDALGEAWPLPLEGGLVTDVRLLKNLFELTQGEVHEVGVPLGEQSKALMGVHALAPRGAIRILGSISI